MYREMPNFKPNEILVYLRRSRSDDPNMTLEEVLQMHETKLRAWIDRNIGEPVPEENFYREIVSGETISDRKEFQKILKRIEDDEIRAVLTLECSRLSRGDMEECGRIMKLFRWTHTLVIDEQQNRIYDLQEEFDREGFEREIKYGNFYLEYSKKLMRRGKDYAVQQGAYVASIPPYGYRQIRVAVGKKKMPVLQVVEEEAKVIRMIFDWYVNEDLGCQRIANRLDEMGVRPRIAKNWQQQSVRKILSNEHYTGKIRFYCHKMEHIVKDQEVIKKRIALEDYQIFDGMHESIVDEETFRRAQAKKSKNPKVNYHKVMRNPLSTLLYCTCGHAMTFCYRRGIPRFECPEQRRCNNASIDGNDLLNEVRNALKEGIEDFSVNANSSNDDLIKKQEEKISYLEKRLRDIEYREIALWEKYTEENMPKSIFDALRAKYEAEKVDAESSLQTAIKEMPERIDYEERTARFHAALEALDDDSVSIETKNRLLKACIARINYSRPASFRGTPEEMKEGQTILRGWISSPATIDIDLKL